MKPRVQVGQIRFFIPLDFASGEYLNDIILRLARLVCYDDQHIFQKESGYRWQLDDSNDWWLDIGANGDAPNEIVIAYRYGLTAEMAPKLAKLRDTIIWLLGLEPVNK